MNTISTLDRLCRHLGMEVSVDDTRLLEALQAATGQIERLTNRHFSPRAAARGHTVTDPQELLLDDDLLELTGLTSNDGSSVPVNEVLRLPGYSPAGILRLRSGHAFTWVDTPVLAITVQGIWGWHDDWSNAWRDSGDVVTATLNASDTTLVVSQANGADRANESPRFQTGQLLKIEDEYLRVLGVVIDPMGADDLLVQRGVNGTAAANHALDTPIFTYQPAPDVEMLVLRWAAWLYREPDGRLIGDVPFELMRELEPFRRVGVKV